MNTLIVLLFAISLVSCSCGFAATVTTDGKYIIGVSDNQSYVDRYNFDDVNAIQWAIDQSDRLELGPGTFKVDTTIDVNRSMQVEGQGNSTVLEWAGPGQIPLDELVRWSGQDGRAK